MNKITRVALNTSENWNWMSDNLQHLNRHLLCRDSTIDFNESNLKTFSKLQPMWPFTRENVHGQATVKLNIL